MDELPTQRLREFCRSTLKHGDTCLVIASQAYIRRVNQALQDIGVNVAEATDDGQYVAIDSEKVHDKLNAAARKDASLYKQALANIVTLTEGNGNGRHIMAVSEAPGLYYS